MGKTFFGSLMVGVLLFQINSSATPVISVDKIDADAGAVYENEKTSVQHTFIVKNKGNSPLKIRKVKASCGCTAVGFDSLILPGKEGKVTQEINLHGIRPGNFRKHITVFSNSPKDSILSLSLSGTIKAYVSVEPEYVQMTKDTIQKKLYTEVKVISSTKDLNISDVSFKSYSNVSSAPAWQSAFPMFFKHELTPLENDKNSSEYLFKLKIFTDLPVGGSDQGRVIIKTNHPKKPEISLDIMY